MRSPRWSAAALAAFLAPMSAHALTVDWQYDTRIHTSGRALATAVIDIDRDGKDELVTATEADGIQIWARDHLNRPYPVSTPGLSTYEEFTKLIVVDLNHDGFQDIVGLQSDGTPHAFLYHPGSGEWAQVRIADATFTDIAVDDLDQDGRLELLGVTPDEPGVHRFLFGEKEWEERDRILLDDSYILISVGRFFDEAFRDIATVRASGELQTWRAISGGPYLEWVDEPVALLIDPVSAVETADFDRDGRDELFLVTPNGIVAIDWSVGYWHYHAAGFGGTYQTQHMAVGDLNRDGRPDVVEAGSLGQAFLLVPGTPSWDPQQPLSLPGSCFDHVSILDFDGDGHADIACSDGFQFHVWRHAGTTDPLAWFFFNNPGNQDPVNDVVGDDLDLDGMFDAAYGGGGVSLEISLAHAPAWLGGVWTDCPPPTQWKLNRLESARLHPWNSYRDLVATTQVGVHVFRNDGACNWREVAAYDGSFAALAVGDLDNDGFDEIAVAVDGTVLLLRLVEEHLEIFGEVGLEATINDLAIGDLNSDGQRDIVAATDAGVVGLWGYFGDFYPERLFTKGGRFLRVAVGDINGDGIPEVVMGGDGNSPAVWVWSFPEELDMFGAACPVSALALGDVTGDTRREIAVHTDYPCSSEILVYTHNGTAVGSPIATDPVRNLRIVDLNRDGENDLLAATDGGVQAWWNRDSQAPIIQLHSFDPDSWNRTWPILEATVQDAGAGLDYSTRLCEYYNAATNAWTNCPSFMLSGQNGSTDEELFSTASLPLSAGVHYLRVRIADLAGNATDVVWNLKYDRTPPWNPSSFRIYLLPSPEARFSGATDHGGSGIFGYEAYLVPTQQATFSGTPNVFGEQRIDMAGMAEGRYYLAIRTRDHAGNWSATNYMGPEYYDRTPPSTPSGFTSFPAKNTWVRSGDITVSWAPSSDGTSGVARYYYRLDSTPTPGLTGGFTTTGNALPYPYSVNTLPEGKYWLNVTAQDNVGNISATGQHGFIGVDRTKPVLRYFNGPPLWQSWNQPFTISWSVEDTLSGLTSVMIRMGREEHRGSTIGWDPWLPVSANDSWNLPGTLLPAHAYHFQLRATDRAGNVNEWTYVVYGFPSISP